MEIGVRDLRNRSQVIAAVRAGERVVLTVHGEAIADIVPHGQRTRWLPGDHVRRELTDRATDARLRLTTWTGWRDRRWTTFEY